ncbi:hypothetical protein AVEN_65637-1 [Araneus ventricosus]|uniref:Uncharacterized protein n=1 Tax=Araneus ventricosus TaxID=182803 RepID=A0A4Y2IZP0_ARAVE|nr:hypothetical protein AVEN_65637-1 [Araneus ventricosus]
MFRPTPHPLNFHITLAGVSLILDFRSSMRQVSVHRESLIVTGFVTGTLRSRRRETSSPDHRCSLSLDGLMRNSRMSNSNECIIQGCQTRMNA